MERELKYTMPDPETGDRILESRLVVSAAEAEAREIEMRAVYYDTADGALARAKAAFRIRREDGRTVATAKTRGEQLGALYLRGEWETEVDSEEPDLRAFLAAVADAPDAERICAVLGPLMEKRLVPLCGTEYRRATLPLAVGGAEFELCVDRGELVCGTRRAPFCEVELELTGGDIAAMEEFGAALCDAYGLRPEEQSKFQRALSLRGKL